MLSQVHINLDFYNGEQKNTLGSHIPGVLIRIKYKINVKENSMSIHVQSRSVSSMASKKMLYILREVSCLTVS
jgi:hypothetical protein